MPRNPWKSRATIQKWTRKGKAGGTLITAEKNGQKLKIARTRDFDIRFSTPIRRKEKKK